MDKHFALSIVAEPAEEPVSRAEAKLHLKVDEYTEDDGYIDNLITAARQLAENFLRRSLVTQTWQLYLDEWPERSVYLPLPPLQSVSSVKYLDSAGVLTTLTASTDYVVDAVSQPGRVYPAYSKIWPTTRDIENAIVIEYVAGYGAASAVPKQIKQAMLLMIRDLYDQRGSVSGMQQHVMPLSAEALLWQYRDYRFV